MWICCGRWQSWYCCADTAAAAVCHRVFRINCTSRGYYANLCSVCECDPRYWLAGWHVTKMSMTARARASLKLNIIVRIELTHFYCEHKFYRRHRNCVRECGGATASSDFILLCRSYFFLFLANYSRTYCILNCNIPISFQWCIDGWVSSVTSTENDIDWHRQIL